MKIRTRLTLQFLTMGAVILMLSFTSIYFFQSGYSKEDFYNRLQNKASNTAKLLIEVEEVNVTLLRRMDKDNPMSLPRERIIMLDEDDSVIYSTDDESTLKIDPELIASIRDQREVKFRQGDAVVLGMAYPYADGPYVVIIAASDIYGQRKIQNLLNILVFVFVISLIVLLVLGWIYSGRALKPISRVIDQVDEISITSLNLRVDEGNGQDEIAQLARNFNKMLDRLETAFQMQRNFIANASHELRTPLTSISGQLEVLLMKKRSAGEYEQAISSVLDDMINLNNISNRLLLLAQASAEGHTAPHTPIRVDDILWQAKEELLKRNKEYKIHIQIDPSIDEESKLIIRGDEQLTKTAIMNLLDNGCKFSKEKSVRVEVINIARHLKIRFIDKGIGISPDDLGHLFEPFHRGKNVLQIRGHGIGLSLAERVVKNQQGYIFIESKLGVGTTITMEFPLMEQ